MESMPVSPRLRTARPERMDPPFADYLAGSFDDAPAADAAAGDAPAGDWAAEV
jgi:hypothetical protein